MEILMQPREKIIRDFAEWTVISAVQSKCPIKSREKVYPLLRMLDYNIIFKGERISNDEFNEWHKRSTTTICDATQNILPVGWAVKYINIYLKTRVYIGNEGRSDLVKWIHPPIDGRLWKGIKENYKSNPNIIRKTHIVKQIQDIKTYEQYKTIIDGCSLIAQERECMLIEVEELWQGTKI